MEELRQRQPRVHNSDYMGAIAKLPCLACMVAGRVRYGVHVAHVRMMDRTVGWREVGKQEKPDDVRTLPLCPDHHLNHRDSQHNVGEGIFYKRLGLRPSDVCLDLKKAFDADAGLMPVIVRWAGRGRTQRQQPGWFS